MPSFIEVQLATLVADPPTGPRWIPEPKFNGYRMQAPIEKHGLRPALA